MGYAIQQSNTLEPIRFLLVLSADHITGATGQTPTVTIAKNTGVFVTPAGAVTEVGNGWYSIAPNAVDASTLGPLLLHATATACDPTDDQYDVVSYNPTSFAPTSIPVGPSAVTALELIQDAFDIIGVRSELETMESNDTALALRLLNQLIGQWSLMALTIPVTAREVFTLVASQGGPTNPYTIGVGGDFDTTRPTSISAVSVLVTSGSTDFEVPCAPYTESAYWSIVTKDTASTLPAAYYFSATYTSGWASLYLYPVPSVANDLVIYRPMQLSSFTSLTTAYDLPPGAADALTYALARRLARPYQRVWSPDLMQDANDALALFKRSNTRMIDLTLDVALTTESSGRGGWDIETGA
jgi:hypothetical protein